MTTRSEKKSLNSSGINKVLQQFGNGTEGTLSPSRYEIMISSNGTRNATNIEAMKRLSLSCETAVLPGRNISSTPKRIAGPVREMPYESIYSADLDLVFRVGSDMFERKYFETWMDMVVNHKTHTLSYYDDYVRDIEIFQLDKSDNIVYKAVFRECFPKTLNPIDLGFEKVDEYMRQSVSIAFREYEVGEFEPQTGVPKFLQRHQVGITRPDLLGNHDAGVPEFLRRPENFGVPPFLQP
ncbi:TPA: hypothetical protein HA278_05535 [Candidatus Woesearchaeota archaeon]|nr:hypothetical protein [Candidatus Woesearchaeota archaeon]